jgi:hypothetical protein
MRLTHAHTGRSRRNLVLGIPPVGMHSPHRWGRRPTTTAGRARWAPRLPCGEVVGRPHSSSRGSRARTASSSSGDRAAPQPGAGCEPTCRSPDIRALRGTCSVPSLGRGRAACRRQAEPRAAGGTRRSWAGGRSCTPSAARRKARWSPLPSAASSCAGSSPQHYSRWTPGAAPMCRPGPQLASGGLI